MSKILLSSPSFNGNEWKYVKDCIDTEWVSLTQVVMLMFEKEVAKFTKAGFGFLCKWDICPSSF